MRNDFEQTRLPVGTAENSNIKKANEDLLPENPEKQHEYIEEANEIKESFSRIQENPRISSDFYEKQFADFCKELESFRQNHDTIPVYQEQDGKMELIMYLSQEESFIDEAYGDDIDLLLERHPVRVIENQTEYSDQAFENIRGYETGLPDFMETVFSYELDKPVNKNETGAFSPRCDNNLVAPQFEALYSNL